jgi:hypothetical protein
VPLNARIVDLSGGDGFSLLLSDVGIVYAFGSNFVRLLSLTSIVWTTWVE